MPSLTLGHKTVGDDTAPYVIAEIGVNHEGSMETAKRLIELAKEGGADAAKFQTYKAATLASRNSPAYWDTTKEPTESQFALFQKHDSFGDDDYRVLAEHCRQVGIDFLSTPFDHHAVDLLDPLVAYFKIASADVTNIPLLRRVAATGKPVVLSTGASNLDEIARAADELAGHGAPAVALLHCVLNYPTDFADAHLNMIEGLAEAFPDHVIGYSDHTVPEPTMSVLSAAYAKGARVIEKHFTHDKTLPGNDHYHAMDVDDLKTFTANMERLVLAGGRHDKAALPEEDGARQNARRSIFAAADLPRGTRLGEEHLICKRPAAGIGPEHWDEVIGGVLARDLAEDEALNWTDLETGPVAGTKG